MTPERWQQIHDVLEKALEIAPEQRSDFLNHACSPDSSLRQEVESLLASSDHVRTNFLQPTPLPAALTPGAKLGEYEIVTLVGSGGMGEVYRARDARLGREVAIKVLPMFFAADAQRLRRFEQEARAAAALNHPNILAVFQMGTHQGAPYLVSELLEGETLRAQLKRGRLAVRKAIDYGVQIAHGLAAAHEKGIVHRDLKPENLFVTKSGRVKILDFGLAKLTQPQPGSQHDAPRLTEKTEEGVVMGTVGYMSPEQVRGQSADHRTDIFSFGAILYEMLTGTRAFQKPTSPETMTAILNEDPPGISEVAPNIPPAMQRVVHRCLEKNPGQRFQSASDLAFALDALSETASSTAALSGKAWQMSRLWAVAAVLVAVVAAGLWLRFRTTRRPEAKHELVERQLTANPADNSISAQTLSRDGKYLAYSDFFSKNLYLLAIDSGETRQLPLPAQYRPVDWFPDGNHLLLTDHHGSNLWKMSIWDSSLRKLWGGNVSAAVVSFDGAHVAFVQSLGGIWLMGGDGQDPHQILAGTEFLGGVAWSPNGHRLAYIRFRGTVAKREVTIETCDLLGGAQTVVLSDPALSGPEGPGTIAWLADGRIVYSVYSKEYDSDLWAIIADPSTGEQTGGPMRVVGWKSSQAAGSSASADGKRMIVGRSHRESGIYIGNLAFGGKTFTPRRLTLDGWFNSVWSWTKDSDAVLFESNRNGRWAIFKQGLDSQTPETVISGPESNFYPVVSAQGTLLYSATASTDIIESGDATMRLMSTPLQGGVRSTLMMGSYYYACGSVPSSSCVVSELKDKHLIFFHLDPLKGKGDEIARLDGYQAEEPEWDLSPDGSRLAIVDGGPYSDALFSTVSSGLKNEIRILNVADRKITEFPVRDSKWQVPQAISWAADGKSFFVVAESTSSFALLSIDAKGDPRALYDVPVGAGFIASAIPSPDGRYLAFTKWMYVTDVMLLENF